MHGRPTCIEGQAGYYMATGSPILNGTWEAATAADTATHAAPLRLNVEDAPMRSAARPHTTPSRIRAAASAT